MAQTSIVLRPVYLLRFKETDNTAGRETVNFFKYF